MYGEQKKKRDVTQRPDPDAPPKASGESAEAPGPDFGQSVEQGGVD